MAAESTKPKLNTARGKVEVFDASSFDFEGVTARVFPLRADTRRLGNFCNTYYNIVPDEIAYFRPALSYVYLAVLHYDKMEAKNPNRGWVSQNEVAFIVPLEWHRKEGGRWVFVDWAYVTPFIFVDDDISLTAGREVYGWPKIASRIEREIDPWVSHPRNPSHLMTMSTAGFLSASAGKKATLRKLLDINLKPSAFLQFPPALSTPFDLLRNGPQAVLQPLYTISTWLESLLGLPIPGFSRRSDPQEQANRQGQLKMIARGLSNLGALGSNLVREQLQSALLPSYKPLLSSLSPEQRAQIREQQSDGMPSLSQITLKQFRDSSDPYQACYQALVDSQMKIASMKDGGLLGGVDLLCGEPTGGFQLHLHYDYQGEQGPYKDTGKRIMEELGLEIAGEWREDDHSVALLKPFYPFWAEVDLHYGHAETLCWRAGDADWRCDSTLKASESQGRRPRQFQQQRDYRAAERGKPQYNNIAVGEPFSEKDASVQEVNLSVYQLLADQEKLAKFCDAYLNTLKLPRDTQFKLPLPWVLMIVMSLQDGADKTRWVPLEVAFSIPVTKWEGEKGPLGWALVSPFVFTENEIDAIVDRELNGRPTMHAELAIPSVGLGEFAPDAGYPLLMVKTEVFLDPKLHEPAKEQMLLEVWHGDVPPPKTEEEKKVAAQWEAMLGPNPQFGNLEALAREMVQNKTPINSVMLKQFMDAENLQEACYQAIVQSQWEIKRVDEKSFRKTTGERYVKIYEYAFPKIAETLGLQKKRREVKDGVVVEYFESITSFSTRTTMQMGWKDRETLYWRAGDEEWKEENPPAGP